MSNQPGDSPDQQTLIVEVVKAIRAMQGATHDLDRAAAERLEVNPTDLAILGSLSAGPLPPKELARLVHISAPSFTVALRRLVEHGWVRRIPDPSDGRRATVELTAKAREDLGTIYEPLRDAGFRLLASYSVEELDIINRFTQESTVMQLEQAQRIRDVSLSTWQPARP